MTNGNDLAYPFLEPSFREDVGSINTGLTKREHFAALAMQGFVSAGSMGDNRERICLLSVFIADKLIEELNRS